MKKIACFLFVAVSLFASAQTPHVFLMDADHLAALKKKAEQKDKAALQLITSLQKQADEALNTKPVSVIDKAFTPPSSNKHDYMSQAPYFWYDSTKPNGLPYIRRDGQHNPEIKRIPDHDNLSKLDYTTRVLALAYYFTGDEKYAAKAASLIRYWFFDDATKMNPNLDYAQAIPGITKGRGIGIIETRSLTGIADAAGLLAASKSWTVADTKALQSWYAQYLNWLLTSKNGKEEHAAKNNHGTWFYAQAIDFALFTGDKAKALQLVNESKLRLDSQLTKEGQWPLELERTNALGYSTFNTQAWFDVAKLAEKLDVDLWHYKTSKGASLQTAVDWLLPYAVKEKTWTYQQIGEYNGSEFYALLLQAANKFGNDAYRAKATAMKSDRKDVMTDLLYW